MAQTVGTAGEIREELYLTEEDSDAIFAMAAASRRSSHRKKPTHSFFFM
jgi:hypothetical protein